MTEEIKALETVRSELQKVKERYQKKAEKERAKINDVYITIQGERCFTEKEIHEWTEAGYISSAQEDRYIENLIKKQENAGQTGRFTQSERISQALDNTISAYTTEIVDLKRKEQQEQERQERWKIAQEQGLSFREWFNQEEANRQSEEND